MSGKDFKILLSMTKSKENKIMTEIPKKTIFLDSVYHKNIPSEVEDTLRPLS